jgi:hypothetical protein
LQPFTDDAGAHLAILRPGLREGAVHHIVGFDAEGLLDDLGSLVAVVASSRLVMGYASLITRKLSVSLEGPTIQQPWWLARVLQIVAPVPERFLRLLAFWFDLARRAEASRRIGSMGYLATRPKTHH